MSSEQPLRYCFRISSFFAICSKRIFPYAIIIFFLFWPILSYLHIKLASALFFLKIIFNPSASTTFPILSSIENGIYVSYGVRKMKIQFFIMIFVLPISHKILCNAPEQVGLMFEKFKKNCI